MPFDFMELPYWPRYMGILGSAVRFFDAFPTIAADVGVVVVEGGCPGSGYIGAELRVPVDEANEVATQLGYPVRFQSNVS